VLLVFKAIVVFSLQNQKLSLDWFQTAEVSSRNAIEVLKKTSIFASIFSHFLNALS
jgi:hypothetical protein